MNTRSLHSQSGVEVCGGFSTPTSCVDFSDDDDGINDSINGDNNDDNDDDDVGAWVPSHSLQQPRDGHSSWSSPSGLVLMGGMIDCININHMIIVENVRKGCSE